MQPRNCFVPFHWNDTYGDNLAINQVTNDAVDPVSKQPAFKYCAVSLKRVGPAAGVENDRRPHRDTPVESALATRIEEEGHGVMVAMQSKLELMASAFAMAIDLKPVPAPTFTEPETVYLSGFISGLQSVETIGYTPVIPPDAPFSEATKLWLDGVLAGLYSRSASGGDLNGAGHNAKPFMATSGARSRISVLWASQTGNSEALADTIAAALGQGGIEAEAVAMSDYDVGKLATESRLVLVSSTYGDGDPPDNGKSFWDFLNSDGAPRLDHLSFAVCALGDPSYDLFCNHGRNLDARLTALGAKRLIDRIDCDPDFEEQSAPWIEGLRKLLADSTGQEVAIVENEPAQMNAKTAPRSKRAEGGYSKANPFVAKMIGNVRLSGSGAAKDTRFFAMSLAGSDLTYKSGDALGVWPSNSPELVAEVIEAVGLAAKAPIAVKGKGEIPLDQALLREFELARPSREMLRLIAERGGDREFKAMLADDRKEDLKQFLWGRQLADLLAEFPIKASAEEFVGGLKRMQPRSYSISSSPKAHPDEVHLTVSAVRYGVRERGGTCSTFLADRASEAGVPIFIQPSSHFHLPADPQTPIIMIGPGTGIAPFRGFLHERRALGSKGRNWLFFGEQHASTDFYYRDELMGMRNDGLLTDLSLAFSRDQSEKIYVQHRLIEHGADVWAWMQEGAHVYVCGDASKMAKDVEKALIVITRDHGGFDDERAQAYVQGLTKEKRYLRDVY